MKLHPYLPAKPLAAWTFLVMAILIAALPVAQVLRTLQALLAQSRRSGQILAEELHAARCLRHVATQSMDAIGIETPCEKILDAAVEILHADLASIQMVHAEQETNGKLKLLGHRGFSPQAAKRWEWVGRDSRTTCGEALRTGGRVIVPDVRNCDFMAESEDLQLFLDAGIHSAQTFPLVSRSGALLGMVTTYWRQPHELSESELRASDILARLAADVIEHKLIEERLWASEARLTSAQRLANLGSWERDDVTKNTVFSDEIFSILGMPDYPPRTLPEFLNFVHPEDRERVLEGAMRARSTGASVAEEYRIIRADGEVRFVRSVNEAIRNEHGAVIRVVGATQDITDLKRAQEESAARQKLESVGALASGLAHDFNNLLGGVLAQAELALGELAAGSRPEEELKAIRNVAIRGSEVVRQLMIYAGKDSAIADLVDVSQIAKEMIELLKVSVSKHVTLETELGQGLLAVRTNAAEVRQIVMNLVTNASEALGDRDGVIRVTTRCVKSGPDASMGVFNRLADGDYLQLEVSDNGCGMFPETQARVFDPFFTTKSAGRGLGLAVVGGIVRGLGGGIRVASEPGKGTTFQVLLPCAETKAEATNDTISAWEESVPIPYQECTVLIVEDEVPLRQAVVKKLGNTGFKVLEAPDGTAAINFLKAVDKIDVILLDMTIHGASSAEVIAEAAKIRPDIRVILTSAYSEEMVTVALPVSHICSFIRKPFQLADLVKTLRRVSPASFI
jgi:signal transduction histidine kinase